MDHIVASHFERLRKGLPQATFKECKHVFEKMRMIKSSNEIEALRDAARATENSILAAFEAAHVGDTELSIAKNIGVNLAKEGSFVSFSPKFFIALGSGDRCYINHPQPTEKRVENGEAIRIDLGPMFNRYWADVSGYAHVGKPDETFRRDYEKLVKIYHNLFDFVRPGLAASEVYEHCKSLFTKHGLLWEDPQAPQFCVGHGIGLEIHEAPTLGPDDCNRLEENMVLSLEICGPWTQRQALAIEDLVLVTNSGAEWLSRIQDEPYLIK
jgi:Xaa-Pro aminopeptidase